jgi:(2Fe-2S) ferredoxin
MATAAGSLWAVKEMERAPYVRTIFVCCNEKPPGEDACANRGSAELQKKLKDYMKARGLQGRCRVSRAMCFGLCSIGPNVCVMPENVWYSGVGPQDLETIQRRWIDPLCAP